MRQKEIIFVANHWVQSRALHGARPSEERETNLTCVPGFSRVIVLLPDPGQAMAGY